MGNVLNKLSAPLNIIRNPIFLFIFLNGFLLALILYFYVEDNYENQIFKALASQVKEQNHTSDHSVVITTLQLTHNLEKYRQTVFGNKDIQAIKSNLIRPVTFDLMTGSGACGSYAYVLNRILEELSVETRFAQMKVGNNFGGHIVSEAKINGSWVVLDPLYNLSFKKEEGGFASFDDVRNNWEYFSTQVPNNYDLSYNYADVRYTNWSKIPVVMPALKKVLDLTIGSERTNAISLRSMFLRKYDVLFKATLVCYILITMLFIRAHIRQSIEIENFRLSLLFAKKTTAAQAAQLAH